jgi:hypothetical protein
MLNPSQRSPLRRIVLVVDVIAVRRRSWWRGPAWRLASASSVPVRLVRPRTVHDHLTSARAAASATDVAPTAASAEAVAPASEPPQQFPG